MARSIAIFSTGSSIATGSSIFIVPGDFGRLISVEALGAGAHGTNGGTLGNGGKGGAYAKITSLSDVAPNKVYQVQVGITSATSAGFVPGLSTNPSSNDTWFSVSSTVLYAQGGSSITAGGLSCNCIPSAGAFSGGNGSSFGSTFAGGGGGAAGRFGAGSSGTSSGKGGTGDAGFGGAGGSAGNPGSPGTEWATIYPQNITVGSGGGGGGTNGNAGLYGAGGGGGALSGGGTGSPGLIIFTYEPLGTALSVDWQTASRKTDIVGY